MAAASSSASLLSLRNLGGGGRGRRGREGADCGPVLGRVTGRGRSRSEVARSIRTIFEALETRQLMSVLPAPDVSGWTQLTGPTTQATGGYNTTPSIAYDPVNPKNMVMVYQSDHNAGGRRDPSGTQNIYVEGQYTTDGGVTWHAFGTLPDGSADKDNNIPLNLHDFDAEAAVQFRQTILFTEATYPTVAYDRNHNVYISYTEHRTDNTFGAIVLQSFDFSGGSPVLTSQNGNYGGSPDGSSAPYIGQGKVIDQWFVGVDEGYWPTLAVDSNLSATDIGALPGPLPVEVLSQADPHSGTVYVAWGTQWTNSAPVGWTNFNPNGILMSSSTDGGVNFAAPTAVNDGGATLNTGLGVFKQAYRGAERDVTPHIVISQGTASGGISSASVTPGTVTVVWDDINSGRTANPPVDIIKAKSYDGNSLPVNIFDTNQQTIEDGKAKLFTQQTISGGTFSTFDSGNAGDTTVDVLAADVDGDKLGDIIALNQASGEVTVLQSKGNGDFVGWSSVLTGFTNPTSMALADLNGDKTADLIVVDALGVWYVKGTGDTSFFDPGTATLIYGASNATGVAFGNFDKDASGLIDVAVSLSGATGQVAVLLNGTTVTPPPPPDVPSFGAATLFDSGGANPLGVAASTAAADFNNDGNIDLAVVNSGSNNVAFLLGNGDGSFRAPVVFGVGANPKQVIVAGLDGTPADDVAVLTDDGVYTLLNATAGPSFNMTPPVLALAADPGEAPARMLVTDFNGDNKSDVVVTNSADNSITLGQGRGDGTLFRATFNPDTLPVGNTPLGIAAGDVNNDQKADLVVANSADTNVSVLVRQSTAATLQQPTPFVLNVPAGTFAGATSIDDFDVNLAIFHQNLDQLRVELLPPVAALAKIEAELPWFTSWVLLFNHVDQNNTVFQGLGVTGSNMGFRTFNNTAFRVGTTFDDGVARSITDGAGSPWTAAFAPEEGEYVFQAILKYMQDPANLSDPLNQLTPADLEGNWTLSITDYVNNTSNGVPPVQYLDGWGINFTTGSGQTAQQVEVARTKVLGSLDGHNPLTAGVANTLGIGPGISVASDNTLGQFSPHQGRIYMTYVDRSTATGNPADNTDVQLVYSDDGGLSWSNPVLVNDDLALTDGYSESVRSGNLTSRGRAQFNPVVSVDQYTGTVVITYSDARQDASRVRFANMLTTSIDGGSTFAASQFLNRPNTAVDATTGKTVVLGPIPDNGTFNDDPEFGMGYHNAVVAVGGHVQAMWAGNMNGGIGANNRLPDILTANVMIAAGPRVISSTMGVVGLAGDLLNAPAADGTPVLRSFVLTFDRPVDYNSIFTDGPNQNIFLYYREPGKSGNDPGTLIALDPTVVPYDAVTGVDQVVPANGLVTSVRINLANPLTDGAQVGTYSYYVNPTISDLIRKPTTLTNPSYLTRDYLSDAANSNLTLPRTGTGGSGSLSDGSGPDDQVSTITVAGVPEATATDPVTGTYTTEFVTGVSVTVNLLHTNVTDLMLRLVAPDGVNSYILGQFPANGGRNMIKTVFSSSSTNDIATASAPYTGTFGAQDPLTALVALLNDPASGVTRNGAWKLIITDNQGLDAGTLLNWKLSFSTSLTSDYLGNRMDQNGDATPGETAWSAETIGDVYANPMPTNDNAWDAATKTFHTPYNNAQSMALIVNGPAASNTQTYASQGTPVAVPDPADPASLVTAESTITIGDPTLLTQQQITNLTVTIGSLTHDAVDTLQIELVAPDGTVILLHRAELYLHGSGGTTTPTVAGPIPNIIDLVFDDTAATFISSVSSPATNNASGTPYSGRFKPEGLNIPGAGLGSLDGKSLYGTWTLRVTDTQPDGNSLAGSIDSWSITATSTPVTVNPPQTDINNAPTVNSVVVTFDHDMDPYLMTTPGAIPGLVSPVASIQGPLGPIAITPTYTSVAAQSGVAIPDGGTASSTISIADTYKAGHVTVKLDLAHANDQDLVVKLVAPDGVTSVTLINGNGGTGANFTNTILDDFAPVALSAGSAPFSNALGYVPVESLDTQLGGMSVKGTWTLQVTDSAGNSKAGVINSWSMSVTPQITAVTAGDPAYDATYTNSNRTFRIYLPDQKVSGSYSLTLSPELAGAEVTLNAHDGLRLDSDKDAGLDAMRDAVVAANAGAPTLTVPYVYNQNAPATIPAFSASTPGSGVVTSILTVTDSFDIQNLTVRLNATFANDPDLTITLTSPDGTTVTLFNQFGAFGTNRANFSNTVFNDAATTPVQNGAAPYAASFKPQQALSNFKGLSLKGDWTLTITSKSTSLTGTLNNWSLTASKEVHNTGLGEAGADQATVNFRIFNMNGGNSSASTQWTPVTSTGSSPVTTGSNSSSSAFNNGIYNTTNTLSAGSITDIAVDPTDPSGNTVFVATASGGIWKTTNFLTNDPNGPTYVPLTDFGPVNGLNIGSVAVFGPTALAPANVKLTGSLFATPGSYFPGMTADKALDGSFSTFFWGPDSDYDYVGYHFTSPTLVTQVKFAPATSFGSMMVGGKIQGSTNGTTWTDLYTITSAPLDGTLTTVTLTNPGTFSYVRYLGPAGINAHAMISELEFYGPAGNTVSTGASNKSVIVAGTGQGSAGYTDQLTTTTTDGTTTTGNSQVLRSPGVGFLLSTDGGATWNLLDSLTNVDSAGNWLPIGSSQRDHKFLNTATFKVVVDPRPTQTGDVIIYAALTGPNGGLYRSVDTGKHWTLMRAGDCTDIILDSNSAAINAQGSPTGNIQTIYAGFRGEGVFVSPNRGGTWTQLLGNAGGTPLVRDGSSLTTPPAINTLNTADPNGNKGRIVLAMPSPTGNAAADTLRQGWIYAAVVEADASNHYGKLDGLYVTKDFGLNWTEIPLNKIAGTTFAPTNDPTDGTHTFNVVDGSHIPGGQGNYDLTLAVDPSNPAVIYVGGSGLATDFGIVRVDTTRIFDAHSFYTPLDAADGGQLTRDVTAAVGTKDLTNLGPVNPFGSGTSSVVDQNGVASVPSPQYLNLTSDPRNPFVQNGTFYVWNTTGWQNTGQDAFWHPIDNLFTMPFFSPDSQRVLALPDPVTGQTRLILATDSGLYTTVAAADGSFGGFLGSNTVLTNGSRNGNLANAQVIQGAAQPGSLAAQLAGAMFYAMTNTNGIVVSDPGVLTSGDVTGNTNFDGGTGGGIAADQTGSGSAFASLVPFTVATDFFQYFPPGSSFNNVIGLTTVNAGGIGRTTGLITSTSGTGPFFDTQDVQWPDRIATFFAVNPVNGNQLVIGSYTGTVFATSNQGQIWSRIAAATDLDGTTISTLAFGAPDTTSDSLSNLVYVGTSGSAPVIDTGNGGGTTTTPPPSTRGQVFVSFTGGGSGGANAWVNLDSAGLDGSAIRTIVTNPNRGSHEVYVVTEKGVYYMADASAPGATWTQITGNLLATTHAYFGNATNYTETLTQKLTALTADWRYAIPNASGTGTHPVLYASGDAGVYRSLDNGATWTLFPNQAVDGAEADGGYLPTVKVTDLDLSLGVIDPTTGMPQVSSDSPSVLLASTYGRGQYAIRVAPIVMHGAFGQDTVLGERTITGLSQLGAFGNSMTFNVYDVSDPSNPTPIALGLTDTSLAQDGTFSITLPLGTTATHVAFQAVDGAGVAGPMTTLLVPPATPSAPNLQAASDSGASSTDDVTNVRKPTIDDGGSTVAAGNKITVYLNGVAVGLPVVADGSGHWSFTFPNTLSDGTYAVTVTQTDAQNQTSVQSSPLTLVVDGTGPAGTPEAIPSTTVNVALTNINVASFTDAHQVVSATINWGDGSAVTTVTNGSPADGGTFDVIASHTYTIGGNHTVTVTAVDNAGNTTSVTTHASVLLQVYPFSLTGQVPAGLSEGSAFSNVPIAIVTDGKTSPAHTASDLTATVNWGDGTSSVITSVASADGQIVPAAGGFKVLGSHTYVDNRQDQSAYDVTVTITTSDGKVASIGSLLNPVDVAPTAALTQPANVYVGQQASLTVSATDPSSADVAAGFTYLVDWGDGSSQTISPSAFNGSGVGLTHTFATAGTRTVKVTATDKDGKFKVVTQTLVVKNAPALNGSAVNGSASRSDIRQITFNVSDTDIAGGVSLSNLKLYYNGDGEHAVDLGGALLAFDPASGNGTLDLSHLTTPLRDGDYQLQISVGGKLFVVRFFKLQGDLNGDGVVDGKDLKLINKSLGKSAGQPGFNVYADLNQDGVVNNADVNLYNKLKNRKATGGTANLTLRTGQAGTIPTLDFGKVQANTNGGYIDLVIKNTNPNLVSLNLGKFSVSGGAFHYALSDQPWGQSDDVSKTIPAGKSVTIRVYLNSTAKPKNLAGKLKFSFATISKRDYKDVTVPLKAVITAAPALKKGHKKAIKRKHHHHK